MFSRLEAGDNHEPFRSCYRNSRHHLLPKRLLRCKSSCSQRQKGNSCGNWNNHATHAALQSLKVWPLLTGFRGKAAGDVDALLDAVMAVADYAQANADQLVELDVNPVLVLPEGRGVLAVDALIRLKTP